MIRIIALGAATLLAACSSEESGAADQATPETMAEAPAHALPAPENDVPGRAYRHTSLAGCEVVREEREEMPFVETLCPGPAGWALRVTDSDARQNLVVVAPGGREASLELSRIRTDRFHDRHQLLQQVAVVLLQIRRDCIVAQNSQQIALSDYQNQHGLT